jgi:type IV pilus secretin PilQ/predicted competence protein
MVKQVFLIAGILCFVFASDICARGATDIGDYLYDAEEKTISMDFKNAPLNDVLKILSQQSGMNFIASEEISGKMVNIYLDHVSVEEALERILSANNLAYELKPDSNIFVVKKMLKLDTQLITRVYPLKHATVGSSKLYSMLSFEAEGDSASSGGGVSGAGTARAGIVAAVKALMTQDGIVIEDQRTNSLVVTDIPAQFPLIEQTIARLDVRIPQILIEVEMLDVSKTTADLIGNKFGNTPATFTGAARDMLYPFNRNKAMENYGKSGGQGFQFEDPEFRVGTLSFEGLTMTLQFLRTQSDTKNLARPQILTLNNETAEISITTNEAIGVSSVTTAAEGTSTATAEAERVETGVHLKVTPQINSEDGEITMSIEPKVVQARTGGTFGDQTFKDPEERGTKSILRVKDGDTVVIGGLLRTDVQETNTQVPFLGRIPVIGSAFRHKDKAESQRELIIFITPHIVEDEFASHAQAPLFRRITREQDTPASAQRLDIINKELSYIEDKKF